MLSLFAKHALLPHGWARDVRIDVAADGNIAMVHADTTAGDASAHPGDVTAADAEPVAGVVLPGMPNLHSHAFQRAMAGLAEHAGTTADSFWTWREVMYRFVDALTPEDLRAIAAQLYLEMVTAGFTAVGEFHYLHHAPGGGAYADRAAMAEAVIAAAADAGIGITLLPVLYQSSGFGGAPAHPGQRRFLHDTDAFAALVSDLASRHADDAQVRIGMAPHSLRAVPPHALARALQDLDRVDARAPIHIHVAEQVEEVDDCLAWSGARPVQWLLEHAPVGPRWCLVHATHMTSEETQALARSGAVVGLCPTTEANLGDGLFPLADFLAAGGRFGVGSDSHVSVSPVEELRWLEYGQRLHARARNVAAHPGERSTGARLYRAALAGGAQALGRATGAIAPGQRADLVVLDDAHPQLCGRGGDALLDSYVFSGNRNPVRDVMIGGTWVVRDGVHPAEAVVAARFRATVARLVQKGE